MQNIGNLNHCEFRLLFVQNVEYVCSFFVASRLRNVVRLVEMYVSES